LKFDSLKNEFEKNLKRKIIFLLSPHLSSLAAHLFPGPLLFFFFLFPHEAPSRRPSFLAGVRTLSRPTRPSNTFPPAQPHLFSFSFSASR
jgi:hypothetical protein